MLSKGSTTEPHPSPRGILGKSCTAKGPAPQAFLHPGPVHVAFRPSRSHVTFSDRFPEVGCGGTYPQS